jgi:hypothetical protein
MIYIKLVPIIWVFTYKTDISRYLTKFKTQLYIKGNLQKLTYKDTYTITLEVRLFKALMAIIIIFDLNCWQGDAINTFANSLINKVVYIKCLDKFVIKGKYLLLVKVLYGLR